MRNFQQLAAGVNTLPLLHTVQRQPTLWNENKLRTTFENSPHCEADDIWLRFNEVGEDASKVMDEHESINYPAMFKLPQVRPIIYDIMRLVEGERLGRVLITRIAPGKQIYPHVDSGSHAEYYDRYHVMLANPRGSNFHCGSESVFMAPGDVWWFNNSIEHAVINHGDSDRITMIVDIRTTR